MNDPILVLKNREYKSDIPQIKFTGGETSDIDIISYKKSENSLTAKSSGMIRLRNRSYKPVKISYILFEYLNEGDNGHIGIMYPTKYGFSDKETMKSLDYVQKVSKQYRVKDDHNVLEGYRDEFKTLEKELIDANGGSKIGLSMFDFYLQPREISNLKIYYFKYKKSEGKESVVRTHIDKIKIEEKAMEKAYKSDKVKKNNG